MKKAKEFLRTIMDIGELRSKLSSIANRYSDETFCKDITDEEIRECIGYLTSIIDLNKKIKLRSEEVELALGEMESLLKVRNLTS